MKRRSVVRVRWSAPGYDENGDPLTSTATETTITGCLVAPRREGDGEGHEHARNGVIVGLTVYAPRGADLLHTDQINIDGDLYDVEGEPGNWDGSRVGGVEVALRRSAG